MLLLTMPTQGVLNLNSGNIKFLNLKNTLTPSKYPYKYLCFEISFRFVNCDEQILVLDFNFFNWCFGYESTAKEFYFFDQCFRHLKYQVDYSLVE